MPNIATSPLVDQLRADHLPDVDLKAQVEAADPSAEKSEPTLDPNDPKAQEEYAFSLNWKDKRGKVWKGDFVTKILNLGERQMAGALQARYANVPIDRLAALPNHINMMMAHLTFSLKVVPPWAKDLRAMYNPDLLQAIYDEVASHEATFYGLEEATPTSQAKR